MIGPTDLLHPSPTPHFKTFHVFLIYLINDTFSEIKEREERNSLFFLLSSKEVKFYISKPDVTYNSINLVYLTEHGSKEKNTLGLSGSYFWWHVAWKESMDKFLQVQQSLLFGTVLKI
jgi:hypothetical protein